MTTKTVLQIILEEEWEKIAGLFYNSESYSNALIATGRLQAMLGEKAVKKLLPTPSKARKIYTPAKRRNVVLKVIELFDKKQVYVNAHALAIGRAFFDAHYMYQVQGELHLPRAFEGYMATYRISTEDLINAGVPEYLTREVTT